MTREKVDRPERAPDHPRLDEPRPASQRLINQLQAAVRRAQERKENPSVSPLAAFAAEIDAQARGREPVEFMGSLGKRASMRAQQSESDESVQ